MQFIPTRNAGLDQLKDFLPRAGLAYANNRNHDDGQPANGEARSNVSQLSPWLHAGLLSEAEVIEEVLGQHSSEAAEKFIAEVFWRVYFKGYLEQRPSIWRSYCEGRDEALAAIGRNAGLAQAYAEATEGRTGLAAFDHWARELVATGYLHNHARMWFASIWIFTLKLDWQLGADFFLRHLVDGDAASNTLSWRWVGGLHTKGKTYRARPDNIARYTANHPDGPLEAHGLAEGAPAIEEPIEHQRRKLNHLPASLTANDLTKPYALILHDEAASHVPLFLPTPPALIIAAVCADARSPQGASALARGFAQSAVAQGAAAAGMAFDCPVEDWTNHGAGAAAADATLNTLLKSHGIDHVALSFLPIGWTRDALISELRPWIDNNRAHIFLSDLSRTTWPHAKAGFFGVKKQIAGILAQLGITGSG